MVNTAKELAAILETQADLLETHAQSMSIHAAALQEHADFLRSLIRNKPESHVHQEPPTNESRSGRPN